MTLDVISAARRRTRRFALAVLIGVGALAALVYPAGLYVNAHLDDQAPTPPTATDGSGPTGTTAIPTAGGVLPADVSWTGVAGVSLPASAATGPAETVGGLARGFARTRPGVMVAALHLLVRTTPQVGPAVFVPTLTGQVTGEHATAMRTAVAEDYRDEAARAGVVYGEPLGDLPATIVGVRVDAYTDTAAGLSVLTSAVDATNVTRYAATTVTLLWADGDWRLIAPPDGRWDTQVHLLDPALIGGYPPLRTR